MDVGIIDKPLTLEIYGLRGIAANKNYVETAFGLSGRMWKILKEGGWKNEGKNIWVYDEGDEVFTGVRMEEAPPPASGLETKKILLSTYAYYKHTGPYQLIRQVGSRMRDAIKNMRLQTTMPYIEVYGHWQPDEEKLETELIMALV